MSQPEEGLLMLEKNILFELPIQETPNILFASFYVFNTHNTDRCTNLFSFFEFYFFEKKEHCKKTRVASIISQIH